MFAFKNKTPADVSDGMKQLATVDTTESADCNPVKLLSLLFAMNKVDVKKVGLVTRVIPHPRFI
jgi:hypothetical protein